MEFIFKNPFFNNDNKILINGDYKYMDEISLKEIYKNFNKLYIICLKDNVEIDDRIYNKCLSLKDLEYFKENINIYVSNIKLLKNSLHKNQVILVDNYYLNFIKTDNYDEINLLLPLLNLSDTYYKKYIKQYINDIKFEDYLSLKSINHFYNNKTINKNYFKNLLINMDSTDYWINMDKLNLTNKFIDREFKLSLSQKIKDIKIKNLLENLNKIPKEGDIYLSYLYRDNVHVDISLVLKKNGYNIYYLENNLEYNKDSLNNILDNLNDEYEIYNLIISLLISKKYCHLILKNSKILEKFNEIIEKYILGVKYAMCYAWLCMYSEECIKKSYINEDDRFVFTINEANNLPKFTFKFNELRSNPYYSFLVSEEVANLKNNIMGVKVDNMNLGVCDLDEFRRRSNIFITEDENKNIFEGIDMSNLGITGSIIPACITLFNPLQTKFNSFSRYINEYYCDSDIDIICNIDCNNKFIDRIYKFYNELDLNYKKLFDDRLNIFGFKNTAIIVNNIFIKEKIVNDFYDYDYVIENLDNLEIKSLFYEYYLDDKIKNNEKYFQSKKWSDDKYNILFKIELLKDVRIILLNSEDENSEKYNNNSLFMFKESLKFKIFGVKLNHNFEIFNTKYPVSFFSIISKFHLPCVRGYYNGDNVYLLPSCISAANTLINLDYKYFAGSIDPIDIINKYRIRGYSTILNDSEKIKFIKYVLSLERTSLMYNNPSLRKQKDIDNILGYFEINDKFFNPREVLYKYYLNNKPVELNYNNININFQWREENNQIVSNNNDDNLLRILDLNFINMNGYIKPVRKWYFDAIYDYIKHKKN